MTRTPYDKGYEHGTHDGAMTERERAQPLADALAEIAKEAAAANEVIRLNRDGRGQGRIRVATAMHRIHAAARAALAVWESDT